MPKPGELLTYSTAKIITLAQGRPTGSGTGFFWLIKHDDMNVLALITNKHVISGADAIQVTCHRSLLTEHGPAPSGDLIECNLKLGEGAILDHPDPEIDLCAINFTPTQNYAERIGKPIYYARPMPDTIPDGEQWNDFDAIVDVLMIGYPRGISDEVNNLPIVRRGITATPLSRLYNGRPEFMVDMACFPGSSGSPVFVSDLNGYLDRARNTFVFGDHRVFFVGVLYAGPLVSNNGIVLGQQPRVEVATMMHLGQVLRSTAVLELDTELRKLAGFPPQSSRNFS
jgi:hypothetical protein